MAPLSRQLAHLVAQSVHAFNRWLSEPCLLCGARASIEGLCDGCHGDLPRLPSMHCPICAIPTSTPDICGRCLKRQPRFDSVCAALLYAFPVDRIIQLLKFSGNLRVAKLLSAELMRVVDSESRPDILIPMPLSKERLRERGFNQAIEIARALSVALRVPLELDACVRQVHTAPQMGLPLAERRSNIRNAFRCDRALRGARIAVVDDVLTSGTTLDELARTLKRAGASQVTGWIAARTPERP